MDTPNQQPTFLYVEDDMMSRHVITLMLKDMMGYTNVIIFEDSENFLERVRALPTVPDVIFLDVHIRPHNGFEMLTMLRGEEAYKTATIIAMTASVMAFDVQRLREAGFDGLIAKPVRKKHFPDLLQRILKGESIWFVT